MRWLRLLSLGLASVYPLYWTAQFVLFFLPESLFAFWFHQPVQVVSISYLQATATAGSQPMLPAHWEALIFAGFFTTLIVAVRGDRFLTGSLAIVLLAQSALLPFLSHLRDPRSSWAEPAAGCAAVFLLMIFGLCRVLRRTGGLNFIDRLALLSLLAVLPQAALWLVFRMAYPYFGTRFLLLLLVPLYLAAILAAAVPPRIGEGDFSIVPLTEILATSTAAALLIVAITLSSRSTSAYYPARQHLSCKQRPAVARAVGAGALPEMPAGC